MQEWTYRHDVAKVDFAGVDNAARNGKGGHCGSGQCRSGQIGNMGSNNRLLQPPVPAYAGTEGCNRLRMFFFFFLLNEPP